MVLVVTCEIMRLRRRIHAASRFRFSMVEPERVTCLVTHISAQVIEIVVIRNVRMKLHAPTKFSARAPANTTTSEATSASEGASVLTLRNFRSWRGDLTGEERRFATRHPRISCRRCYRATGSLSRISLIAIVSSQLCPMLTTRTARHTPAGVDQALWPSSTIRPGRTPGTSRRSGRWTVGGDSGVPRHPPSNARRYAKPCTSTCGSLATPSPVERAVGPT